MHFDEYSNHCAISLRLCAISINCNSLNFLTKASSILYHDYRKDHLFNSASLLVIYSEAFTQYNQLGAEDKKIINPYIDRLKQQWEEALKYSCCVRYFNYWSIALIIIRIAVVLLYR
jgi:hypothetical protein